MASETRTDDGPDRTEAPTRIGIAGSGFIGIAGGGFIGRTVGSRFREHDATRIVALADIDDRTLEETGDDLLSRVTERLDDIPHTDSSHTSYV